MKDFDFKNKKMTEYTLEELIISLQERAEDIEDRNCTDKKWIKENLIFALDIIHIYDVGDEEFFILIERMNGLDKAEADHFLKLYEKIKTEKKKGNVQQYKYYKPSKYLSGKFTKYSFSVARVNAV